MNNADINAAYQIISEAMCLRYAIEDTPTAALPIDLVETIVAQINEFAAAAHQHLQEMER